MRYLRQQNINRRAPADQRLYIDMTDSIVMNSQNNLLLPKGTEAERPVEALTGMIRYNTTSNEIEVYQGPLGNATWRSLRFKEVVGIIQQDLHEGDFVETLFGPLDPAPPTIIQTGSSWTGANLLVIIENVIQIFNVNYTIVTNPPGTSSPTGFHGGDPYPSGSYISFDSPVPSGKTVFVLHNFDK